MKNKTKVMSVLLCGMLSIMSMPFTASASDKADMAKDTIEKYIALGEDSSIYGSEQENLESYFDVSGYQLDKMMEYTIFEFSAPEHGDATSMTETLAGYTRTYVPYENENGVGMIQLHYNMNGEMYVGQHTTAEALLEHELLDTAFIEGAVAKFFSEEVASGIQYLELSSGDLRLAFFTADGEEYVMPFFISRFKDSIEGITEGDIYTAENFLAWIGAQQKSLYNEKGEMLFGGNPDFEPLHVSAYAKTGYRSTVLPAWLYPAVSGAALLGICLIFGIRHIYRRRKPGISAVPA